VGDVVEKNDVNFSSSHAHSHEEMEGLEGPKGDFTFHEHREKEESEAKRLYSRVRVLCWVATSPENHEKKAKHIKATWGKRCNKLLFMSTLPGRKHSQMSRVIDLPLDQSLPAINLNVTEGRDTLWGKTYRAFNYIYDFHLNEADWFMKADDDTYVILENLRYMLEPYKPTDPIYFGCKFKPYVDQGYMSGGAGYVLSKEAVKRFAEEGFAKKSPKCHTKYDAGAEDVEMGRCMENLNVSLEVA